MRGACSFQRVEVHQPSKRKMQSDDLFTLFEPFASIEKARAEAEERERAEEMRRRQAEEEKRRRKEEERQRKELEKKRKQEAQRQRLGIGLETSSDA